MPKCINTGCLPVQTVYNIAATFSFIAFKSQSLFSPAKIEYRTIVGVPNINVESFLSSICSRGKVKVC